MTLTIRVTGVPELVQRLGLAASLRTLRPPMERSVMRLQAELARYPSPSRRTRASVYGTPFQTDRQRRGFFARLRSGAIQVPYRRTGTLGRSWTTAVDERPNAIEGRVGNNVAYGPFVQGDPARDPHQSRYHQGTWVTDAQVVEHQVNAILADFQRTIDAALRG